MRRSNIGRARKRSGKKQWRGEVRGRRGKCAAHLPDGSFGSAQHAVMAVLQYGALPPDCHTVVDTNSVITLLMCLFCMISLALLYLDSIWSYKIDDKVK